MKARQYTTLLLGKLITGKCREAGSWPARPRTEGGVTGCAEYWWRHDVWGIMNRRGSHDSVSTQTLLSRVLYRVNLMTCRVHPHEAISKDATMGLGVGIGEITPPSGQESGSPETLGVCMPCFSWSRKTKCFHNEIKMLPVPSGFVLKEFTVGFAETTWHVMISQPWQWKEWVLKHMYNSNIFCFSFLSAIAHSVRTAQMKDLCDPQKCLRM